MNTNTQALEQMPESTSVIHQNISPSDAEEMLELNVSNRPINRKHVETLAQEMRTGRWRLNGDAIRFSGHRLLDGQHRLAACVKAGVPFDTFVVHGLDFDVFKTIDAGKPRSATDTLSILNQPHAAKLAATIRFVDTVDTGRVGQRPKVTNTELSGMLQRYSDIHWAVEAVAKEKLLLMPFGVTAGLLYSFSRKEEKAAQTFFWKLSRGEGLLSDDPVYVLRERLLANAASKSKLPGEHLAAFTVKAWNAIRTGKELKQLSWRREGNSPEVFPEIL